MNKAQFGNRLKAIRDAHSCTQAEIAKQFDVSLRAYSNYENNRREPEPSFLTAVCERYGISPAWLLLGEGEMRKEVRQDPNKSGTGVPSLSRRNQPDDPHVSARLEAIDAALNSVEDLPIPITADFLAENAAFVGYKDELVKIALSSSAAPNQKARADWILRYVYADQGATARHKELERSLSARRTAATATITRLGKDLGYDAPMIWTLLVHELLEWHGLEEPGARRILEVLRDQEAQKK